MSNAFLGQITMFGGNYAPRNTALCNGQTLPINQNAALFSLLGTDYGGNGTTTFQLPNLQSRLPIHQGQGPGLSNYIQGQPGGAPSVTIDGSTMPAHSHAFNATTADATSASVANNLVPAKPTATNGLFYAFQGNVPLTLVNMYPTVVGANGGSAPHTNLMPSLCISFIIYLQGIFPSRN